MGILVKIFVCVERIFLCLRAVVSWQGRKVFNYALTATTHHRQLLYRHVVPDDTFFFIFSDDLWDFDTLRFLMAAKSSLNRSKHPCHMNGEQFATICG